MEASWDSCQKVLRGLKRLQEPIKWPGASDDTTVFPKNKVLAFFEEENKIDLLGRCSCKENVGCLSARGFTDMEVSKIRESFTSVLGFLVCVKRGNRIFYFIQSDSTDQRLSERPLEDSELSSLLSEDGKAIEDYEIREIRKIHHQFFLPNLCHKSGHYDFDRVRSLPLHEIEQLGDGGFSHVYRAKILDGYHDFEEVEQVENGVVAIKSFKGKKDYGRGFCRRERRHNEFWNSHRYIIPLLASLNRGDHYMIIFPLASHDLRQLMGRVLPSEYLDGRKAWFQFANLLSALHYVHTSNGRKGYHFDLKPSNILVRSNGDWALTDFGIAYSKEDSFTSATGMSGSSGEYSPPETTRVRRSFDIWSMGCIGCEISQWLKNGPQGVDKFRFDRGSSFHFRKKLKGAVLNVLKQTSTRGFLTNGVVECLRMMLKIVPEERVTAKEAETSIRQIISIPGEDDSGTLNSTYKLISTCAEDQKKTEGLQLSVKKRRMIMLGEAHPDTLDTMHNLVITYYDMKRFTEAESLGQYTMEKRKAVLGEDHPDTLTTMHNLAGTYHGMKRFTEAESLGQYTMEKRKAVLGEDHPDTLATMHNLAGTYHGMKRFTEAESLGQYTMEKMKAVLGEDYPDTLATMHNLASTYYGMKRFTEAESLGQYTMEKMKAVLGEDHPDTLGAAHNLVTNYQSMEWFAETKGSFQYTMEKSMIAPGVDHPDGFNKSLLDEIHEGIAKGAEDEMDTRE